jgi:hypothetical protein
MRANNKKFLGNKTERRISRHKESKDCIIWEVYPQNRVARVRIQGSSKDIMAKYPQSWEETPTWLKKGNVARIVFTGGVRGRVELVGTGHLRPTPYDGSAAMPTTGASDDGVLSGGNVYPIPLNPRMAVMVKTGTYQIGGVSYSLGPMTMGVGNTVYMGDGVVMGQTAAVITIDSVASGYYRYDLICVGTDGVVDYVKGTAVAEGTEPTLPDLPADHVMLGRVFVYPGLTAITENELSSYYVAPDVTSLSLEVRLNSRYGTIIDHLDSSDMADKVLCIVATTKDQYGNTVTLSGTLTFGFQFIYGAGTLYTADGVETDAICTELSVQVESRSSAYVYYLTPPEGEEWQINFYARLLDQVDEIMGTAQIDIET